MKEAPKIMGIVNTTPDSFSDGGDFYDNNKAVDHALKLIDDGADILDIGGESTRPGAERISVEEELNRTIPVISGIRKQNSSIPISIDTTKYEVAKQALGNGASIINDISGLRFEEKFIDLAKEYDASLILMHMQGTPGNMQMNPHYDNVVEEVYSFLKKRSEKALNNGVKDVYVDVGIGFGKKLDHNLELLRNIEKFNKITGKQVLGISRKSFIKMILDIENPKDRDMPTTIIHTLLLDKNIDILRVHNVRAINDMLELAKIFR